VPRVERSAAVTWEGNVARGAGLISADSGAFAGLPYSLPTRVGQAEGKTSPEELLAAAHAGCLAMSLSNELSSAGTPPERLEVHATIRLDEVEGRGHLIVGSRVTARGRVPGLASNAWDEALVAAHEGCTFSTLLGDAGAEVTVVGELETD
jgi:osmotically inducible protein OsmC